MSHAQRNMVQKMTCEHSRALVERLQVSSWSWNLTGVEGIQAAGLMKTYRRRQESITTRHSHRASPTRHQVRHNGTPRNIAEETKEECHSKDSTPTMPCRPRQKPLHGWLQAFTKAGAENSYSSGQRWYPEGRKVFCNYTLTDNEYRTRSCSPCDGEAYGQAQE